MQRINGWSVQLLSFGGKMVLIKSILQSLPLYTMAALAPPVSILRDLEKIFCNFLWSDKGGARKYHWFSWEHVCRPKD